MTEPAPGFLKHPDHRVRILAADDHVRVLHDGRVLADTDKPLRVEESRHAPVWYIPLVDVAMAELKATDHTTYCPFKGHARYWTVTAAPTLENAVWGYPEPYQECLALAGHVAFYADRVTLEVNGQTSSGSG